MYNRNLLRTLQDPHNSPASDDQDKTINQSIFFQYAKKEKHIQHVQEKDQ